MWQSYLNLILWLVENMPLLSSSSISGPAGLPGEHEAAVEQITYAIQLPANRLLRDRIGYLPTRLVGRPKISERAENLTKPRRFIVTNMNGLAERVFAL
jgi:hypothetical protein